MIVPLVTLIVVALGAPAFAADKPIYDGGGLVPSTVPDVAGPLNLLWVIIGAVLVIFMQAGFALVETGFCRAKHASHVVSTNFAIFGLGFVGFFLIGYRAHVRWLQLPRSCSAWASRSVDALIGSRQLGLPLEGRLGADEHRRPDELGARGGVLPLHGRLHGHDGHDPDRLHGRAVEVEGVRRVGPLLRRHLLPAVRRLDLGWRLARQLGNTAELGFGYVDFAGSGVVHAVGGAAALAGAIVLGARIGKYGADGKPRTLAAHSIPMAMLGTFILLFGWFGFNAASTFAATDVRFAMVAATNTAIAAAFGATAAMFYVTKRMGKPDPGMMCNGMLAGLVAITAPCAFVQPWAAAVIGILAAIIVIESCIFFERKGIDDPVGAISVHGVGGIFGVLCVGIFSPVSTAPAGTPRRRVRRRPRAASPDPLRRRPRPPSARGAGGRCARDLHRHLRHRLRASSRSRTR